VVKSLLNAFGTLGINSSPRTVSPRWINYSDEVYMTKIVRYTLVKMIPVLETPVPYSGEGGTMACFYRISK